jgi:hypothetical protein
MPGDGGSRLLGPDLYVLDPERHAEGVLTVRFLAVYDD